MQSFKEALDDLLTDLAWSLWTELGVAGVERRHARHSIDPESLIIFTADLGDTDPRLRDESMDWCIRYDSFISEVRLRNLLKTQDEVTRNAFGEYAATINANGSARWPVPSGTAPLSFTPSGKSVVDFSRPAVLRLRMRALFGVGARAELLTAFLGEPAASKSASELTVVGYAKRNVAQVLSELHSAGLLQARPIQNRIHYRLARVDALRALAEPLPDFFLDWSMLLTFAAAARHLAMRPMDPSWRVSAVAVNQLLMHFETTLASFDEPVPKSQPTTRGYWENASDWILRFFRGLSSERTPSSARSTSP